MTDKIASRNPSRPATWHTGSATPALDALRDRLRGPGGYYNIGNSLALTTGLGVQIAAAFGGEGEGAILEAARNYFVGSSGAAALTLAIAIFFVSGEMCCRAWSQGFPRDRCAPERPCRTAGSRMSGGDRGRSDTGMVPVTVR